ncbi:MAG: RnfABCDGE type electron transport complex subunit D [Clostridia bacterium]|nr:RnfABCDGE type electron transport complex subunit D [Clostridia bacterium]
MSQLFISASPHIRSKNTTTRVMLDVIIALMPAVVASFLLFGGRSLLLVATSVATAVLAEFLFNLICKKENTLYDLSAVVTGILLALNVPVSLPLWQIAVGSAFAIIAVKGLFGGIGQNFANPAIAARIMMILSFGGTMSVFHYPADTVASATPLAMISGGAERMLPDTLDLFLGRYAGCIGETCSLALILGGVYLLIRKVISWHTPVAFIGTVFVGSFIFSMPPVAEILTGGLLLGAIFMATDYSTTPITKSGKLIFGFGCGLITLLIRKWGSYPEGVSFAILFMNILTPYIEKWTVSKPLGGAKK